MSGIYDPRLVTLTVAIAMIAAFTALNTVQRVTVTSSLVARTWLGTGALVVGAGVWTAQYFSMLAFRLPIIVVHHLPTMLFALCLTIVTCFFALWLASGPRLGAMRLTVVGLCLGLGLAGMQFTGVIAMQIVPAIHFDAKQLALSFGLAVTASWILLVAAFATRQARTIGMLAARAGTGILAGVAISGAHFTGMTAVLFDEDSYSLGAALDEAAFGSDDLLLVMAAAAVLILLMVMLLTCIDHARPRPVAGGQGTELTGLALLEQRFGDLHEQTLADERMMALVLVVPGEAVGHQEQSSRPDGTQVLEEVSRRLATFVRPGDSVSRLEKGEFALLLTNLADAEQVERIAARVHEELGRSIGPEEASVLLAPRLGASIFPRDGEDLDTLLRIARRRSRSED